MVNFTIDNGMLEKYSGDESEITIPEGITKIGKWPYDAVFKNHKELKSVIFPKGLLSIGDNSFYGCSGMTSVIIPEGVKEIGYSAFAGCSDLKSVSIPDSVTSIGYGAFANCCSLSEITLPISVLNIINSSTFNGCNNLLINGSHFLIINSVLKVYTGQDPKVTIPDGVTRIKEEVFSGCTSLTNVNIPDTVIEIEHLAFENCKSLREITIPSKITEIKLSVFSGCDILEKINFENKKCKILWDPDYDDEFINLTPIQITSLHPMMGEQGLIKFVLSPDMWEKLSPEVQADIFLSRQSKSVRDKYHIANPSILGDVIAKRLLDKPTAKVCDAAASFAVLYYPMMPKKTTEKIFNNLKTAKTGTKAVSGLESNEELMAFLNENSDYQANSSLIEQKVMEILKEQSIPYNVPERNLNNYYGLDLNELPEVMDTEENVVSAMVLCWLLTVHESLEWGNTKEIYEKPGICDEAQDVIILLNSESFQQALIKLTDVHLGGMGKKSDLSYPICRYADEKTMEILTKMASGWSSSTSGKNAPALRTFRNAAKYSTTKAALLFAEKYGDLDDYARLRGVDTDSVRDQIITDTGLDSDRSKTYDLGNQIVKVRLQNDFSFTVELPDGKTAKSLPKKNADPEKYAAANEDFSGLKKNIKKIIKNRINSLFDDFLSGRTRNAESWKGSYLGNPMLRDIASLLVWRQGDNTFTLTETDVIDSAGNLYSFTDEDVCLAYPAEMDGRDMAAWQDYFMDNHLKQPFMQIWEPVRDLSKITPDRYKGIEIPYYRFLNQEKHGISIKASYDGQWIDYDFKGLNVNLEQLDYSKYWNHLEPNSLFEIKEIKPNERSFDKRYANHIIVYLDRIMIRERIQKDDTQIVDFLPRFTAAQINEFISIATEANAVNVTAMLLEYKNTHYPDLDPLSEFTLDFL